MIEKLHAIPVMPVYQEPSEHGDRAAAADLSEAPIDAQLLICHAHVHFIQLRASMHTITTQQGINSGCENSTPDIS